jgi:hypothetical protein
MQIIKTVGGTFNLIAREPILATKDYTLQIISKNKNKVILTDTNPSFLSVLFYTTYITTQTFLESSFYTLELTNTTDGTVIFKDMIFCTDQPSKNFKTTSGIYQEHDTGANEYKYYTAP